jgi:outer membrane protein assembly factor BamB
VTGVQTCALPISSLYVAGTGGSIARIDLFTGRTIWNAHVGGGERGISSLAIDGSGLYCAASHGMLRKFGNNGELLWRSDIGDTISTAPVLTERLVFVPTRGGSLFGIDKTSGVKVIKLDIENGIRALGATQKLIFIASGAGRLHCYDYRADEMLWSFPLHEPAAGGMVIESDSIYLFGGRGRIYRISMAGALVWTCDLGSPIAKRPSADASSFYIPAGETLYVVDKTTGAITWSLLVPQLTSDNVAVSKGSIFFGTDRKGLSSLKK